MNKFCKVSFDEYSRNYSYKTNLTDLQQGDLVIVPTRDTFKIGTFEEYMEEDSKATRWLVSKVDFTEYNSILEKEKKLKEIKDKMDKRKETLEQKAIYKMMAESDPSMKDLLMEYEQLEGDFQLK